MDHRPTRNVEGWYWLGLCASVLLCAALWAGWRLVQIAQGTASLPPLPRTDAAPPVARTPEPWYVVNPATEQCTLADADHQPAQMIKDSSLLGVPYQMQDVTEYGVVVQTTLVWRDALGPGVDVPFRWYRGRQRCEQDHRATVQAEEEARRVREQAQDQKLKKYR